MKIKKIIDFVVVGVIMICAALGTTYLILYLVSSLLELAYGIK